MDKYELNKILGALLLSAVVFVAIDKLADIVLGDEAAEPDAATVAEPATEESGPAAVTTDAAEEVVIEDTATEEAAVEETATDEAVATASASDGKTAFRICGACHTVEKGGGKRLGPNLWGVAGAGKAAVEGFNYSAVLRDVGGVWDDASLDLWLADPKAYAVGTSMNFIGITDAATRANLIEYLKTLAD